VRTDTCHRTNITDNISTHLGHKYCSTFIRNTPI